MAVGDTFYETQARICAESAAGAALPMLREKFERAEAAWRALATRETGIAEARTKREAEKAANADLATEAERLEDAAAEAA